MERLTLLAAATLCLMSVAPRAQAEPVSLGVWYPVNFAYPAPSFGYGILHTPPAPWTFTLGGPGQFGRHRYLADRRSVPGVEFWRQPGIDVGAGIRDLVWL